jgi:hypothetical protein
MLSSSCLSLSPQDWHKLEELKALNIGPRAFLEKLIEFVNHGAPDWQPRFSAAGFLPYNGHVIYNLTTLLNLTRYSRHELERVLLEKCSVVADGPRSSIWQGLFSGSEPFPLTSSWTIASSVFKPETKVEVGIPVFVGRLAKAIAWVHGRSAGFLHRVQFWGLLRVDMYTILVHIRAFSRRLKCDVEGKMREIGIVEIGEDEPRWKTAMDAGKELLGDSGVLDSGGWKVFGVRRMEPGEEWRAMQPEQFIVAVCGDFDVDMNENRVEWGEWLTDMEWLRLVYVTKRRIG